MVNCQLTTDIPVQGFGINGIDSLQFQLTIDN